MTQTPHAANTAPPQGHKFWDDISSTGIRRDRSRQWFGGVCAGVARRVDVDPVLIRAAVIALSLFGGFGIVVYLVAWLLLPDETGRIMAREALDRDGGGDAGGAIALTVIALLVIAAIIFGDNGFLVGWGVVPIAVIGWFFWRHQQRKDGATPSPWVSAGADPAQPPYAPTAPSSDPQTMYAASSAPASYAPSAPVAPLGSDDPATGFDSWQPPPAPPVPPRAHLPLAPPPPPRPRRRSAGFAGFALVLGAAVVGYGVGLMLDDPLKFTGSAELLGCIIALGAASLVTMFIGLSGRRSLMSATLVLLLGLGTAGAAVGDETWSNGQGTRTWTPAVSTTDSRYELGVGQSTLDLRPLVTQLATTSATPANPANPATPAQPQELTVSQGVGELKVIVPTGANARIIAKTTLGDVTVRGDLPRPLSDRDRGETDGPSERMTVDVGTGAPTIIVRADLTIGQITIQEG